MRGDLITVLRYRKVIIKRMVIDGSPCPEETGQKVMAFNCNKEFRSDIRKNLLNMRVVKYKNRLPKRQWNFHPGNV